MPVKIINIETLNGIDESDVPSLQQKFGKNIFHARSSHGLIHVLWNIAREPMFVLLIIACALYFILGEPQEGLLMVAAMSFVAGISVYEEIRSTKALEALQQLTEPRVVVIRDGKEKIISTDDLVPGDIFLLSEGNKVPADAFIINQNDLTVNESIISGESFPVEKNAEEKKNNLLYQGTTINSGQCYAEVTAIGNSTALGKLGSAVDLYAAPRTLLQLQIGRFVKRLALFGFSAFIIILLINFLKGQNIVSSLLFALTLAMAVIPEEIPVAFSSFMALGAYHMTKLGIISRQPQTIENLGAVSVICLDKTGTITQNIMQVKWIYDHATGSLINLDEIEKLTDGNILRYAVLASEANPFDAMEKAIGKAYEKYVGEQFTAGLKMIYEYPLQGQPPMMTHIYQYENTKLVAAKGAAERIIKICKLDKNLEDTIMRQVKSFAKKGFRVIGVASAQHNDDVLPIEQDDFDWKFEGLLSLYDPPKENIASVFKKMYNAGINIKMVTGDFAETAINIAEQVGMIGYTNYHTGDEVMKMSDTELQEAVRTVNIFARMFPDAKLKVINAIKANGEIVAMTGDGVNDAPALRSADIGIAMGEKGTEIARQAANLIISNDDLDKITEAIVQGRKIFNNLKKAVRYIISIHIPIILTASLPLLLGWKYPNIFTPIHIIFLELIMGPTCSIFFEREPVEKDIMLVYPRNRQDGLFRNHELLISIMQGLLIAGGVMTLYFIFMKSGGTLPETRTIVFITLIMSNIFLTFTNRSFSQTFAKTIYFKNNLVIPVTCISVTFLFILLFIPPVRHLFELSTISPNKFLICLATAFISVAWFEVYKMILRRK